MACSQARISYNEDRICSTRNRLWLALRHGSVTIVRTVGDQITGVVACSQARISYNKSEITTAIMVVVACSQARISYNNCIRWEVEFTVVACSQARISYNDPLFISGTLKVVACSQARISYNFETRYYASLYCCGLLSGTDQLQLCT